MEASISFESLYFTDLALAYERRRRRGTNLCLERNPLSLNMGHLGGAKGLICEYRVNRPVVAVAVGLLYAHLVILFVPECKLPKLAAIECCWKGFYKQLFGY